MAFHQSSRVSLTRYDLPRFPGDSLFERIARVVCETECLARKELYESWAVARRVRRRLRGGRVVDLAAGHGLTASLLLLIDETSECAVVLDERLPASAAILRDALAERWPQLAGKVTLMEAPLYALPLTAADVVVSVHACGALTDRVLERAVAASSPVAVLPCCHDKDSCDTGKLEGWMDVSLAIDVTRVARLRAAGYSVHTQTIPAEITPKNRLLIGAPPS
jgi:hypothetical protein